MTNRTIRKSSDVSLGSSRPALTLNSTAGSLLGFLHMGPQTGWDLARSVEDLLGGFWNVTKSQVYRELRTLNEAGLVEAGEAGARDRRPYTLTEAGQRAFAQWISREPGEETIRFPLLLTLFFADRVEPRQLARYLRQHQLRHERQLDQYEQLAEALGEGGSGPHLVLRFGLQYERMVLDWFRSLPQLRADVV